MVKCPNCYVAMVDHPVEVTGYEPKAEVASCAACSLLWFDRSASIRLTPRSVLALFQYIGTTTLPPATPLASRFDCPRCTQPLAFTQDLQRTTRFSYWRCDSDRGQLIGFHQFLRQKNFIRSPNPAELARLRETVRQVSCSQCGGSIDLTHDTRCGHCGAAVALIDPEGIAKAIKELRASPVAGAASADEGTRMALNDAQIDAWFELERTRERDQQRESSDLLLVGIGAVGALIQGFLGK